MNRILFVLFAVMSIAGCATDDPAPPSQFEATEQKFQVLGCEDLKQTIDEYNQLNPDHQLVADC